MVWFVNKMNALQVNDPRELGRDIDILVAHFGLRRVFGAILSRLVRRTRPPDLLRQAHRLRVENLPPQLRRDVGLPEQQPKGEFVDYRVLIRRDLF